MEDIVLVVDESHHTVFRFFLDGKVAAHGEVHDGRSDIAYVHGIVCECANFTRRELIRRLVLSGDGAKSRIAAPGPPQPEHREKRGNGKEEWPIAAQKKSGFFDGVG